MSEQKLIECNIFKSGRNEQSFSVHPSISEHIRSEKTVFALYEASHLPGYFGVRWEYEDKKTHEISSGIFCDEDFDDGPLLVTLRHPLTVVFRQPDDGYHQPPKCEYCSRRNEDGVTCGGRVVEIVLDGQPYYFNPTCEHERAHGECGQDGKRFLFKDVQA